MQEHDEQERIGTGAGLARRAVVKALVAAPVVGLAAAQGFGDVVAEDAKRGGPETEDLDLPAFNSVIQIRDNGQANPYASAVRVSGLKGVVTDVRLILKGLRHERPRDIGVQLDHEGRATIVMRGAGGILPVNGANVLFQDNSGLALPTTTPIEGGRAYEPGDLAPGRGLFGGGANPPSLGSPSFSVFDGMNPNKDWVLYVRDDETPIGGSIAGWQLIIATDDPAGTRLIVDNYRTRADRTLRVDTALGLLAIDGSRPEKTFGVRLIDKPKRGKLKLKSDGSFTYEPKKSRGNDRFTYSFTDEFGGSVPGTGEVRIKIDPVRKKKDKKRDR